MKLEGAIVQKYGGTSVGTPERITHIARRIANQRKQGAEKLAVVVSAMAGETNRLLSLVQSINPKFDPKSCDVVLSAGEQVTVGLLSAALEKEGVPAKPLLGFQLGILTDADHSRARIQSIPAEKIHRIWNAGQIPVVAGFQGVTCDNSITTLGRGGSDTSAVALAVALSASFCEINTDVDGVYTADPRVVPEAKRIERLDYEVALELAALGSKVLHSRCVELGAKYRMPIIVRSSFESDEARRTEIVTFNEREALEAPMVSGVTLDRDIAKITIKRVPAKTAIVAAIFGHVAERGINVDIIVQDRAENAQEMNVGFTVGAPDRERALSALTEFRTERGLSALSFETVQGLSKVSAVGLGMRSQAGVAARMFDALSGEGIQIIMTSTSEIKISCVVDEAQGEQATRAIHHAFFA